LLIYVGTANRPHYSQSRRALLRARCDRPINLWRASSAQTRRLVGAGFKPALPRRTTLARYSLGHPPTAEDYSRCKRNLRVRFFAAGGGGNPAPTSTSIRSQTSRPLLAALNMVEVGLQRPPLTRLAERELAQNLVVIGRHLRVIDGGCQ